VLPVAIPYRQTHLFGRQMLALMLLLCPQYDPHALEAVVLSLQVAAFFQLLMTMAWCLCRHCLWQSQLNDWHYQRLLLPQRRLLDQPRPLAPQMDYLLPNRSHLSLVWVLRPRVQQKI
jgi:hypothetical protein